MSAARKKRIDSNKGDTIQIRAAIQDKTLIEKAAETLGLTMSAFMLENSIKAARRELAEVEKTSLTPRDATRFFAALMSPPAPNTALKAAFKHYAKQSRK